MIDRIGVVGSTPKMILTCQDRSDRVLTVIKTRLDNDVIDYIDEFM